jgi:hypothetical protein
MILKRDALIPKMASHIEGSIEGITVLVVDDDPSFRKGALR